MLRRHLRDCRRWLTWWAIGILALVLATAAFFPTIRGDSSFDSVVADLPSPMRSMIGLQEGLSISTASGYLQARYFTLLLPVLLVVFAIGTGGRAIAGSEADGTLELLLANPVSRTRVLLERLAASLLLVWALVLVACTSLLVIGPLFGLLDGIALTRVAIAHLAAGCLAVVFLTLAFAVGAGTGNRGTAIGAAAAVAVAGYLLQALLANSPSLSGLQALSPWHWYADRTILTQGAAATAFLPAVAIATVVALVGWLGFRRRDLR